LHFLAFIIVLFYFSICHIFSTGWLGVDLTQPILFNPLCRRHWKCRGIKWCCDSFVSHALRAKECIL